MYTMQEAAEIQAAYAKINPQAEIEIQPRGEEFVLMRKHRCDCGATHWHSDLDSSRQACPKCVQAAFERRQAMYAAGPHRGPWQEENDLDEQFWNRDA